MPRRPNSCSGQALISPGVLIYPRGKKLQQTEPWRLPGTLSQTPRTASLNPPELGTKPLNSPEVPNRRES